MRVLLLGANGQLGTDLLRVLQAAGDTVVPVTHAQVDVRAEDQVAQAIDQAKPEVVINTTAFHRVDECETKSGLAFEVNATAPMNMARICKRTGAVFVHFSTDYVFDGLKSTPYEETDLPAPVNAYGTSKVAGEHLVAAYTDRHFVIRTCGLYGVAGSSGKGGNFVETMLKKALAGDSIRVVDDQVLTPTFTSDLAEAVRSLILTGRFGLYQLSSEGQCSWYDFTRHIFESAGLDAKLAPVKSTEFPSPVRRPAYSVLSKAKFRSLGLSIPSWKDALPRYLQARAKKNPLPAPAHVSS